MGKSIVFDKIINECSKNNKIYLDDIKNYKLTDREFDEFLCCLNLKNIELCIGDKENNQDKDVDLYIDDSMDQFLNEIGKYKLLSKEEEVVLFKLYKQGNMNARKQLIESNLRLVVSVAKRRYLRKNENSIQMLDLCQEGTKGLMRAIETFDVDKGCKFSPYATWLIDKKIARYIWENDRTIRIPSGARTKINGIKHFKKEFMQKNNRLPNIQEYMDGLNMKEDQVKIYLEASLDLCSLDATINEEKDISLPDGSCKLENENRVIDCGLGIRLSGLLEDLSLLGA